MENLARFLVIGGSYLDPDRWGSVSRCEIWNSLWKIAGDIRIEGKNGSFYFPVVSSILISVILTILLNVIARFLRK